MKAIRIHGPNDVRYEDVPDPKVGPDDVLIRVKACGVCGTDIELCDGTMFYLTSGMAKLPLVPGHEWAGEVVEVGSNVDEFAAGDRVTGECSVSCRSCSYCLRGVYQLCPNRTETGVMNRDGAFAEYIAFPKYFLHKCNKMEFEDAAFIEPTGVSLSATKLAEVCPNDYVAVMGPGPIGLFAVQTAKAYGARKVILFGSRESRLAVGRQVGADLTINVNDEDMVEQVREATDGHMIDVVLEAAGQPSVWNHMMSIVAPLARIGMTGLFAGKLCQVDFDPVVVNNITLKGSLGGANMWPEAISLHERGLITAKPLITHRLPLSDFLRGTRIARERIDDAIKVIIEP